MHPQQYDAYTTAVVPPPIPHRASSGAWSPQDDKNLLHARQQGLNWAQIQVNFFPLKTSNACRKRHERLMERKGADDWDTRKLQRIAKEYMGMRKEIWQPLAARTGEKWSTVEAKVSRLDHHPHHMYGNADKFHLVHEHRPQKHYELRPQGCCV
jgi:hypothetical protein